MAQQAKRKVIAPSIYTQNCIPGCGWRILVQEDALPFGQGILQVLCKHTKVIPAEGGDPPWMRLKFLCLSVKLLGPKEEECTIRLSTYWGLSRPKYTILWPATTRQTRLDEVVELPGMVEELDQRDFTARMVQMCGAAFAELVQDAFARRFVDLAERYS